MKGYSIQNLKTRMKEPRRKFGILGILVGGAFWVIGGYWFLLPISAVLLGGALIYNCRPLPKRF